MRLRRLSRMCLGIVLWGASFLGGANSLGAAEPYLEFVQGLRARGYHDYAMLYLEQLESRQNIPGEIRQVIAFEKGLTLLQDARLIRNVRTKNSRLDRAEAFLKQFIQSHPNHPQAGGANTERARIFLGKAKDEIWQSQSSSNESNRAEFQVRAREYVKQARRNFQAAHDLHQKSWEAFPSGQKSELENPVRDARKQAESDYIQAQLHLAQCTYEEGQTYDRNTDQFKSTLTRASKEFEEIHINYRDWIGGLHAQMWQGKCFEEQDQIGRALGFYNVLLLHPGKSKSLKIIKDEAFKFRLICLNHEQKKDYQLVVIEASTWLIAEENRRLLREKTGLGIRWQRALAYEKSADDRKLSKPEKERFLLHARDDARSLNRSPGEFKDVAHFMIQRIQVKLGRRGVDPNDFDGAFGVALNLITEISKKNQEIEAEKDAQKKAELKKALDVQLREARRMLRLALTLAEPDTDFSQVNNARYRLSYVYYLSKQSYKAAILGEFVGRHYRKQDPQTALDAAYLAMRAYQQAYNALPEGKRDVEMNLIVRTGTLVASGWPQSDHADKTRMILGDLYGRQKKPLDAAKWYGEVPATSTRYAAAQLAAGKAYANAYSNADRSAGEKSTADQLKQWQAAARKHLETGIEKAQQQILTAGKPTDKLIEGKFLLSQILNIQGEYDRSIELLTGQPHPVMEAIAVDDEAQRPATGGIRSRRFAGFAWQLLLRSYVGTQKIDEALTAMESLEKVVGGGEGKDAHSVTAVYVQLGREIENEIKRLIDSGEKRRLAEVRASLDRFLEELYNRKSNMKYSSLIWIAETYFGLGEGMGDDNQSDAEAYFQMAAQAFEDILTRNEIPPGRESRVKLRLVNCKRRQGDFEKAIELISEVLQARENLIDAQFEAAQVFQDWGTSAQAGLSGKLLVAIQGNTQPPGGVVWGWGRIATRLQRVLNSNQMSESKKQAYREKLLQARYNVSWCRQKHALLQSSDQTRLRGLQAAKQEFATVALLTAEISDEWKLKFNDLYRDIQTGMNLAIISDLEWGQVFPVAAENPQPVQDAPEKLKSRKDSPQIAPTTGPSLAWLLVGFAAAAGGAGGFTYFMMNGSNHRRRFTAAGPAPVFPSGNKSSAKRRAAKKAKPGSSG